MFKQYRFRRIILITFSLVLIAAVVMTDQMRVSAAAGALDNTFDGNGKLATDFNDNIDIATDVVIQPDGKIIVVGVSAPTGTVGDAAIARYNLDGSLDTTFSSDGKLVLVAGNCSNVAVTVSQTGFRIAVAYYSTNGIDPGLLHVTQLTSDGTFDTGFDGDGTASDAVPANFRLGDVTYSNSGEGKIVVVGGSAGTVSGGTPASDWLLWRYLSNGNLDTGFSGDGRQQTDFGGNQSEFATSVTFLANGAMLAAGTGNPADQVFAVARYTTNGSLDTNWGGGDGKIITDLSVGADVPREMKVDANGRILLGGTSRPGGVTTGTIVRYNSDGTIDSSFDGDGIVQSTSFGPVVEGLALQVNGQILGVGGTTDFILGRLNQNGTPDTNFGIAGFVVTDMNNGSSDQAMAVAVAVDRRIVVAGPTMNTSGGTTNFGVARYLPTNIPYQPQFDFDGDNKSDFGIYRPGNGQWWINRSSTQTPFSSGQTGVYGFGSSTDRIAPSDFTGDGKADIALFRPATGQWFVLRSENFSFYAFPFGTTGDVPAPGDYDFDGKADAAVFRPSSGTWYISQSSGAPTQIVQFGITGDQPVVADYDEDGRADIGIFRPGPREWWIQRSTLGLLAMQFGNTGDKPVQGDYTGDGKADVAIFRPSTGEWFIIRSDDFSFYGFPFGAANDLPAPADYDGDGRLDPTVVRGATWFIARTTGNTQIFGFGVAGDRPIPNAFVP